MDLTLKQITPDEAPAGVRVILALRKQPFYFGLSNGTVYMNQEQENAPQIVAAIETMWKHDHMRTDAAIDEIDAAYDIIRQAAGDCAVRQIWEAWQEQAKESRRARAKEKALAWIAAGGSDLGDDSDDILDPLGYDFDMIETGLHDAYYELYQQNPNHPGYRHYFNCWAHAAFAYGFRLGQKAATAGEEAAQDE